MRTQAIKQQPHAYGYTRPSPSCRVKEIGMNIYIKRERLLYHFAFSFRIWGFSIAQSNFLKRHSLLFCRPATTGLVAKVRILLVSVKEKRELFCASGKRKTDTQVGWKFFSSDSHFFLKQKKCESLEKTPCVSEASVVC